MNAVIQGSAVTTDLSGLLRLFIVLSHIREELLNTARSKERPRYMILYRHCEYNTGESQDARVCVGTVKVNWDASVYIRLCEHNTEKVKAPLYI